MTTLSSITSTTSTSSSYTAKGLSGLASGMDTESVVEAMTSDIQAKIDKVKQQQTKYEWKQDAYREVINSLVSFQNKYFSYTNPSTNLLSSAMYNCVNKVAQGANAGKISVTSSSSSTQTAYSITGVTQMAKKAQYIGNCGIGGNSISTGSISFDNRDTNIAAGKELEFKYDNVTYTITVPEDGSISADSQAEDLASLLNKALAEQTVNGSSTKLSEKLKFTASGGKITMKTVSSADSRSFEITGGDSALLSGMGFSIGDKGSAKESLTGSADVDVVKNQEFSLEGKKLTFNLNGLSKTISFTQEESAEIMAEATDEERMQKMADIITDKLNSAFGAGKLSATVNAADPTKLDFNVLDSYGASTLSVSSTTVDTMGKNGIFGIQNGITNRLDTSDTLDDLGVAASYVNDDGKNVYKLNVNGKEFSFTGDTQLSTVLNKINNDSDAGINISYLNTTNKFSISADEYGEAGKILISDVDKDGNAVTGGLAAALFGSAISEDADGDGVADAVTKGQDMVMTIRYEGESEDTVITRNSNSVTLDGVSFNVEGTFGNTVNADGTITEAADSEAITFKNESDTENTIKVIKEMAEEYNKILDTINEYISTKVAKTSNKNGASTYEPLTDAQKKEMTEDEIKNWEEKAKEGILFGDSTLRQLASELRFAFSSIVGGYGYGKDIGITSATSYSGNGKITIDEEKLKEALTNEPEKVKAMFTASTSDAVNSTGLGLSGGFATRVKSIMESYAKDTGSYKGKLVQLAGLKNNATTDNNYIARQQKLLSNRLEYLEDLLASRQDRYQSQFSNLEVYISQMNSQSSWLASAFS